MTIGLAAARKRKWVLNVPVPGGKAIRNGALLPPPDHTEGVRTWDQYLAEELPPPRTGQNPAPRVTSG